MALRGYIALTCLIFPPLVVTIRKQFMFKASSFGPFVNYKILLEQHCTW